MRRADAMGFSNTSNWRISIMRRVVRADQFGERAMLLDEGVARDEILLDFGGDARLEMAAEDICQCLLGNSRHVEPRCTCLLVQVAVQRDADRPLGRLGIE